MRRHEADQLWQSLCAQGTWVGILGVTGQGYALLLEHHVRERECLPSCPGSDPVRWREGRLPAPGPAAGDCTAYPVCSHSGISPLY